MKVLFVPFAPSLAHVSRCLAIAEAWRARGHMAVFALGAERRGLVQKAGFDVRPVPEVPGDVFRTDQGFRWLTPAYYAANLAAERAILADVQPEVVVFDFRFTTALSARLAGRPSVGLLHGNGLRLAYQLRETARLLIGEPRTRRGPATWRARVLRQVFPVAFSLFMGSVARRMTPVLRAHGGRPVGSPFEWLRGDYVLAPDLAEFMPSLRLSHLCRIDPLEWSGWEGPAAWLDELDARPLIYVTMGSTVEAQATLGKIIQAVSGGAYNVVMSTGSLSLPAGEALPAHLYVFPMVPGATVLARSAAVIHHGGHETLMQALAAGVPSLMLPFNPDQILVAQQAEAVGAGYSLRPGGQLPVSAAWQRRLTAPEIRQALDRLLTDRQGAAVCQRFKAGRAAGRGAIQAVEQLEAIGREGRGQPGPEPSLAGKAGAS